MGFWLLTALSHSVIRMWCGCKKMYFIVTGRFTCTDVLMMHNVPDVTGIQWAKSQVSRTRKNEKKNERVSQKIIKNPLLALPLWTEQHKLVLIHTRTVKPQSHEMLLWWFEPAHSALLMIASEEKPWMIRGSQAGVSAGDSNQGRDKNTTLLNQCSEETPDWGGLYCPLCCWNLKQSQNVPTMMFWACEKYCADFTSFC